MRKKTWTLLFFFFFFFFCSLSEGKVVMKSEAGAEVTWRYPAEGNTTFLEGTTWCVARRGASEADLQRALDWACGTGTADCSAIERGGDCFEPDTLLSHASYAFNSYYQTNGNNLVACYFGGTAALTKINPSYGKCSYDVSKSEVSGAKRMLEDKPKWLVSQIFVAFVLLLYWRS